MLPWAQQRDAMHARLMTAALLALILSAGASPARAQAKGSLTPEPLPPLAHPDDPSTPARDLFARKLLPAARPLEVIGSYSKGCIAGAEPIPINGDTWQVMRLSRNRNWGHP